MMTSQRYLFDEPLPAPYQAHSPTSADAAREIEPETARLRKLVLAAIKASSDGLTDQEGQEATGLTVSTYVPRRRELELAGKVFNSGRKRRTRAGKQAAVWVTF